MGMFTRLREGRSQRAKQLFSVVFFFGGGGGGGRAVLIAA